MSLSVGIVGLGRMGARWVEAVENSGHRLISCYDESPRPYALTQKPHLGTLLSPTQEDFWASSPDILVIATPAPGHAPWIAKGLDHGVRRFVVEKPFATSCDESATIMDRAAEAGARVIVNHGREYASNYRRLHSVAGELGMGSLRSIVLCSGAGGTGCVGIHYLRLFNFLFGSFPQSILAQGTTPRGVNPRGPQYDDPGCSALLLYPNERRAYIDIGDDVGTPPQLTLLFERGRVLVKSEIDPWEISHRTGDGLREPLTRYATPLTETIFPGFVPFDIFRMASAALMDAAGNDPPICGADKGHEAMLMFSAIRWSMETRQIVNFPLLPEALSRRYPIP